MLLGGGMDLETPKSCGNKCSFLYYFLHEARLSGSQKIGEDSHQTAFLILAISLSRLKTHVVRKKIEIYSKDRCGGKHH